MTEQPAGPEQINNEKNRFVIELPSEAVKKLLTLQEEAQRTGKPLMAGEVDITNMKIVDVPEDNTPGQESVK